MPGRNVNSPNYRYGFNGQEKDDEIAGAGNINTAEFWEYDTRLGRRWNTDPVVKPWESPYACFSDNPIYYKDVKGDDVSGHGDKGKVTVDNTPPPNYVASSLEVVVKPKSFWGKAGDWFLSLGTSINKFFTGMDNATIYSAPSENNNSGVEPSSKGPNKNVSGKSKAEGIESTSPEYPGAMILGKGGGVSSNLGYTRTLGEALAQFKEAAYGGASGSDAVEYSEIIRNDPDPSLQKEADRSLGKTVVQRQNCEKVIDTIYKQVLVPNTTNTGARSYDNMGIIRENGKAVDTIHYQPLKKKR